MKHIDEPKYAVGDLVYVRDPQTDIEYGFYVIKLLHWPYNDETKFGGYLVEDNLGEAWHNSMSIDEDWIDDTRTKNQA
jgi:hypothetical protein